MDVFFFYLLTMNCFEKKCVDVGYLPNCTKQVLVITDVYSLYFAKNEVLLFSKEKEFIPFPLKSLW